MRRLLHILFAFAVLLGAGAEAQAPAAPAVEACACCAGEPACGCGMPSSPRAPRCPGGQAQAAPTVAAAVRETPQAEVAAPRERLPWEGLAALSAPAVQAGLEARSGPRAPPGRLLQRLALLSAFRN